MEEIILVTGGAGYIGSTTCRLLQKKGYSTVAYDNLSTGHRYAVKCGFFEEGDITDIDRLREVFEKYKFAGVIHFAANALVGESMREPSLYYWNNVVGSLNLLKVMKEYGVRNIVFSSSCAVYGTPLTVAGKPSMQPITEKMPKNPINPYGRTKLTVERALNDYYEAHGFGFVALRYFNAAGADVESEHGEDHQPETHLIPNVIETALHRRERIDIFGSDFPTLDGTAIRDYIHVKDLARAHLLALQFLKSHKITPTRLCVNLGTGQGYSVREIIDSVEAITGEKIPRVIRDSRAGDPPYLVADNALAKKLLGWEPEHSDLQNIISTALMWHQHFLPEHREITEVYI